MATRFFAAFTAALLLISLPLGRNRSRRIRRAASAA